MCYLKECDSEIISPFIDPDQIQEEIEEEESNEILFGSQRKTPTSYHRSGPTSMPSL